MDRVQDCIEVGNQSETGEYELSMSIGIAHYSQESHSSLNELMTQADTLMHGKKQNQDSSGVPDGKDFPNSRTVFTHNRPPV